MDTPSYTYELCECSVYINGERSPSSGFLNCPLSSSTATPTASLFYTLYVSLKHIPTPPIDWLIHQPTHNNHSLIRLLVIYPLTDRTESANPNSSFFGSVTVMITYQHPLFKEPLLCCNLLSSLSNGCDNTVTYGVIVDGIGLIIGFIGHFNTYLVTTLHRLYLHTHWCPPLQSSSVFW
jgi:hypothetical protein